MGAIVPLAAGLASVAGAIGTANQIVGTVRSLSGNSDERRAQDLALQQLQERQRLQQQQLARQHPLFRRHRHI